MGALRKDFPLLDNGENIPPHKKFLFLEYVEAVLFAVVIALVIRHFVLQVYVIPTGSMAPTLNGKHVEIVCSNCGFTFGYGFRQSTYHTAECPICHTQNSTRDKRIQGGDRLFSAQFLFLLRAPRRWEPFVFRFPGDPTKDFIKRLVGLPGDALEIRNGDIYVNGHIQTKPLDVQERAWIPVYDSRFIPADRTRFWKSESSGWSEVEGLLVADASREEREVIASFARPVRDFYGYDQPGQSGFNFVGDLKLSFDFVASGEGGGYVRATIREVTLAREKDTSLRGGKTYSDEFLLSLPVNRPEEKASLSVPGFNENVTVATGYPIVSGRKVHIDFLNYDDRILVRMDGKVLFDVQLEERSPRPYRTQNARVALEANGLKVEFSYVQIFRDIFYIGATHTDEGNDYMSRVGEIVTIPDGHYFALGDNSPISQDSRVWGLIPKNIVEGKAFLVFWPPKRWRFIR